MTSEDQEKINKFARVNARLCDVKDDLELKKVNGYDNRINLF